jgi:integrase
VYSGAGFTEAEIQGGLVEAMRLDLRSVGEKKSVVGVDTFNLRLITTAAFLRWYADACLAQLPSEHHRYDRIRDNVERVLVWCSDSFVQAPPRSKGKRKHLTGKEQAFLIRCLDPSNRNGYGKSEPIRWRNYVAVMLMLSCGLRRGELLSLRVEDVQFGAIPSVNVELRPPDPDDERKPRPEVKRNGRIIPMDRKLARAVNKYIVQWRDLLQDKSAVENEYLILGSEGDPLSLTRLNEIFREIRRAYPKDLPRHLSPHALRHSFSINLERNLRNGGMKDDKRRSQALALMRGDSSLDSQNVYIDAEVHEQASKCLEAYQAKLMAPQGDVLW